MLCGRNSAPVNVLPPAVKPSPRLLRHVTDYTRFQWYKHSFILIHETSIWQLNILLGQININQLTVHLTSAIPAHMELTGQQTLVHSLGKIISSVGVPNEPFSCPSF